MTKYHVTSHVIPYPGMGGWFFAYVDTRQAALIREKHRPLTRGFGSIRVTVVLGKTTWRTSIFPDSHSGTYLLPLKKTVRRAEGIDAGDTITFTLEIAPPIARRKSRT